MTKYLWAAVNTMPWPCAREMAGGAPVFEVLRSVERGSVMVAQRTRSTYRRALLSSKGSLD